jgi:hypothetical protein
MDDDETARQALSHLFRTGALSWKTIALNVASAVALMVAAAWFSYTMFASRTADLAPRVVNSITIEPSILLAGHPFNAHINVTLNRLCPYEVHWSLVRKTDGVEVVKIVEPIQQPPAATGTQELPPVVRYIPASVAAGEYRYVAEVYDLCPEGHTYTSVRHNADIVIR